MKFLPPFLLSVVLCSACSDEDTGANADTIEYFTERLRADMTFKELVKTFGVPDRDMGSGIHIYVYVLEDSSEVRIGFTDRLHSAIHLDSDYRFLKRLI